MIHFKKNVCRDFHNATQYEWIETNGKGSYASSTIIGANTRRYHGLLVSATNQPSGRMLLLSKVEETLIIDGEKYELSANQYPDTIHPQGNLYLKEFRLIPFPKFIYEVKGIMVEKTIMMVHGADTSIVSYNFFLGTSAAQEISLQVRPLVNFRDYHALTEYEENLRCDCEVYEGAIKLTPHSNIPSLYLYHNAASFNHDKCFYRNMEYQEEAYRGFDCHEIVYNPGYFVYNVEDGDNCVFVASTELYDEIDTMELMQKEISRRSMLLRGVNHNNTKLDPLLLAADSFICEGMKKNSLMIVGGYHWFNVWGRDVLVSIPGLTLVNGRYEYAERILITVMDYLNKGMLPNCLLEDSNEPQYNSADTSLWYFYAVHKYLEYTGDYIFVEKMCVSGMNKILHHYSSGVQHGIHEDKDGLITFSSGDTPITWMDVKIQGRHAISRQGKVVEVNALWYNALKIMANICKKLHRKKEEEIYSQKADKVKKSFQKVFWNKKDSCLFDYVDGGNSSSAIRPNQIFAVSLPYSVVSKAAEKQILHVVEDELLTPYGLRTLSPRDSKYKGVYRGGVDVRDNAYHQGTVWAWTIGSYVDAYMRVNGINAASTEHIKKLMAPFIDHLHCAGLGTISEIFDGTVPHHPRGCISQAWSVAEIMRVYFEYIVDVRNKSKETDATAHFTKRF
ncbi:MAG: amylo-alpha-1,6-glucosidase [Candidatus Ancaeobacter aquaticus]|nr:amylo-alpha-1,6-glucosidase [Candidatus Ancaeobacter aquaticus]